MKKILGCIVLLLAGALAGAADDFPLHKGATEIGVFASGGSGLGVADSIQMVNAGVRLGRVLTNEHGSGWKRGNFEYAFDFLPFYYFMQDQYFCTTVACTSIYAKRQHVYGGSMTPIILKWNFTRSKRVVPFAAAEGGVVFTTHNVPAGDTSQVNFTPGVAAGVQWFRGPRSAFSLSGHVTHISNASLGNYNPGMNATIFMRVGYQWWR